MAQTWVLQYLDGKTCLAKDVVVIEQRTQDLQGKALGERYTYFFKVFPPVTDDDVSVRAKSSQLVSYREQF